MIITGPWFITTGHACDRNFLIAVFVYVNSMTVIVKALCHYIHMKC